MRCRDWISRIASRALSPLQSPGLRSPGTPLLFIGCILTNISAYNPVVGGLRGASRRYVTDYWFTMMPEAVRGLEAYLARTEPVDDGNPKRFYTVAPLRARCRLFYTCVAKSAIGSGVGDRRFLYRSNAYEL